MGWGLWGRFLGTGQTMQAGHTRDNSRPHLLKLRTGENEIPPLSARYSRMPPSLLQSCAHTHRRQNATTDSTATYCRKPLPVDITHSQTALAPIARTHLPITSHTLTDRSTPCKLHTALLTCFEQLTVDKNRSRSEGGVGEGVVVGPIETGVKSAGGPGGSEAATEVQVGQDVEAG